MKSSIKFHYLFVFLLLSLSFPLIIYAQTAQSNCKVTKIGDGGAAPVLPAGCSSPGLGGSGGAYSWPFPTKDIIAQFGRVDQGVDWQYHQQTEVLAVAPGIVGIEDNDPDYFGIDYADLTLDAPLFGFTMLYYGHVHVIQAKIGKHVNAGEAIANTDPNGVNSPPNWLEIGFWDPGCCPSGRKHRDPVSHYSPEGQQMYDWLKDINP